MPNVRSIPATEKAIAQAKARKKRAQETIVAADAEIEEQTRWLKWLKAEPGRQPDTTTTTEGEGA